MRILIVEDEKKTAAFVQKGLTEHGFVATSVSDGDEGLDVALTRIPGVRWWAWNTVMWGTKR